MSRNNKPILIGGNRGFSVKRMIVETLVMMGATEKDIEEYLERGHCKFMENVLYDYLKELKERNNA